MTLYLLIHLGPFPNYTKSGKENAHLRVAPICSGGPVVGVKPQGQVCRSLLSILEMKFGKVSHLGEAIVGLKKEVDV